MAKFQPGQSGFPSGRPPRKKPIKQRIENLLQTNLDRIETEIETAAPAERRDFFIKLFGVVSYGQNIIPQQAGSCNLTPTA
jgi:hypothetical protein